jgi:peptidoglycan/LPS O-acetylase OafA/YrhL
LLLIPKNPGEPESAHAGKQLRAAPGERLPTLDALRGIAALAVCWFHFTNAQFAEQFGAYRSTGKYGYLGVQIFFVISGFIIPFSLFRARYRTTSFFRFLLKRIARLDPPYIGSVVVVVVGYWVSSLSPGHPRYRVPWAQVISHLGYLNAFLGFPWLQMSYWSLAIEFQYYIFIGLCLPLLMLKARRGSLLVIFAFAVLGVAGAPYPSLLPHWLPLFGLGIFAFRHKCLSAGYGETACGVLCMSSLAAWVDGPLEAATAIACFGAILGLNLSNRLLMFFGRISYSLYLVHVYVGNVVFGLAVKAGHTEITRPYLPFVTLAAAITAACGLYTFVELPSRRFASRISY